MNPSARKTKARTAITELSSYNRGESALPSPSYRNLYFIHPFLLLIVPSKETPYRLLFQLCPQLVGHKDVANAPKYSEMLNSRLFIVQYLVWREKTKLRLRQSVDDMGFRHHAFGPAAHSSHSSCGFAKMSILPLRDSVLLCSIRAGKLSANPVLFK